jgi:hypothetical protein
VRYTLLIISAGVLLTGCGKASSAFDEWADAAVKSKVDASNVGDQISSGKALVAFQCALWPTASADARSKAPAALAASATKAGYASSAEDALAWLDAHCRS